MLQIVFTSAASFLEMFTCKPYSNRWKLIVNKQEFQSLKAWYSTTCTTMLFFFTSFIVLLLISYEIKSLPSTGF